VKTALAAAAIALATAVPLHAESRKAPGFAEALKATPAVITPVAAPAAKVTLARVPARTPASVPQNGRSFWKSPWPYVIVGAAAVVVLIARQDGGIY
jgi:hypothetical protein